MEASSDTTKILEKGPEYLRKQMELESETKGRVSAVERLAASKLKYVKSQQVVNSTQEPVISIGSASVGSTGSSNRSSNRGGNHVSLVRESSKSAESTAVQIDSPGQVRRSSSKKRPDSLLIHRQRCELLRGSANVRKHHIARKLFASAIDKRAQLELGEVTDKECESEGSKKKTITPEGTGKECSSNATESKNGTKGSNGVVTGGLLTVPEFERRPGKGVSRSHSDISSRYSKSFADFDAFFTYCGLDGEVVESLGKVNFSARSDDAAMNIRSVSVSTSDDGFSRNSDDIDGLLEDELQEKIRQGTSVIERNARIIKWLYSCKNANETGKKLRDLN
ncbi:protein FAM110C [Mugil cephalus]|uniref:protein FAM110C n=1 Tax=Mugil cephalus TaxID=48193 RepID=UPI001FB5C9AE|nr:protein FAM110C [Mugil cephalus]